MAFGYCRRLWRFGRPAVPERTRRYAPRLTSLTKSDLVTFFSRKPLLSRPFLLPTRTVIAIETVLIGPILTTT